MKNRKAFNFYRSYFDVLSELNDKDKLDFLMALLEMQFTGKSRELSGMAKFAFMSQKHSINAQIEGYLSKVGGVIPPSVGGSVGGSVQEKEKVQEKVEVKEQAKEGLNIQIFGDSKEENFIIVKDNTVNSTAYKIFGVKGLSDFLQANMSILNYPEHAPKFMSRKKGDRYNDMQHLRNAYAKFIEKQYA